MSNHPNLDKSESQIPNETLRFRIKKGVTPYPGRIFPGRRSFTGKMVWLYFDTQAGNNILRQRDEREFLATEVEEVFDKD